MPATMSGSIITRVVFKNMKLMTALYEENCI